MTIYRRGTGQFTNNILQNTLPQNEDLGGRERGASTSTDTDGYDTVTHASNTRYGAKLDTDKQWETVKPAWGGDREAYDRYTG